LKARKLAFGAVKIPSHADGSTSQGQDRVIADGRQKLLDGEVQFCAETRQALLHGSALLEDLLLFTRPTSTRCDHWATVVV
jgi:hypothetical protein